MKYRINGDIMEQEKIKEILDMALIRLNIPIDATKGTSKQAFPWI